MKRSPRQPAAGPAGSFAFDLMFRATAGAIVGWWLGLWWGDARPNSGLAVLLFCAIPAAGLVLYYVVVARHENVRTVRFVSRSAFAIAVPVALITSALVG